MIRLVERVCLILLYVVVTVGCGGGGTSTPPPADVVADLVVAPADTGAVGDGDAAAPDVPPPTSCGEVICPELPGYAATCNDRAHCELRAVEPEGWRRWDVLLWVPPSTFPMGSPFEEGDDDEHPQHAVTFADGFWVDRYEMTAGAFAAFLTAHGGNDCEGFACVDPPDEPAELDEDRVAWDAAASEGVVRNVCQAEPRPGLPGPYVASCADHAVGRVTWYGARTFCAWAGKRLCSESEWERAGKGTTHAAYAWGDGEPDTATANCAEISCRDGFWGVAPVGSFPSGRSPVGADDMSGNAREWVEDDRHGSYATPRIPLDGGAWVEQPRLPNRSVRGGDATTTRRELRISGRALFPADAGSPYLSFRCCVSPTAE